MALRRLHAWADACILHLLVCGKLPGRSIAKSAGRWIPDNVVGCHLEFGLFEGVLSNLHFHCLPRGAELQESLIAPLWHIRRELHGVRKGQAERKTVEDVYYLQIRRLDLRYAALAKRHKGGF